MMRHSKAQLKALRLSGFTWSFFEDGLHYFHKPVPGPVHTWRAAGQYEMICSEACIDNGNAAYMAEHNLSYSAELAKKLQAAYRRKERKALRAV